MLTGKQCPHVVKKGRKHNFEAKAFTIKTRHQEGGVNFVADSAQDMLVWTDALRFDFAFVNFRKINFPIFWLFF